jgi:FKBP-type peptidyl-prolyl cis-trans isomerase
MDEFTELTKDRGLYKKILKEGSGRSPVDGMKITAKYQGILEDGRVFDETDNLQFILGEEELITGLEIAIKTMKKGEKSIIVMRYDYAYGDEGSDPIPAYASLAFCVDLLNYE